MQNLSDTKRRLLERWNNTNYSKPVLRKIAISGEPGLRCLSDFSIEFRYPITVIAGENGTGKSTILACAACAYHGNNSIYTPSDVDPERPYYTFGDFFIFSSLDPKPKNIMVLWHYSGKDSSEKDYPSHHIAIRKSTKWSHYDQRPIRPVQFVGISRALPARERSVLRSHFTKSKALRGRKYSAEEKEKIGRILGQSYSTAGRAVSGSYSLHVAESKTYYSGFNMGAGEDSIFELVEIIHRLPEGSLLIIEEIETGLHPSAQVKLMEEIHEIVFSKHIQVILTTHSFDILKSVSEKGRIFLKRLSTEITPLYGISPTYAFSLMSTSRIPELTIYVEDIIAQNLVNGCLPFSLKNRCRTLEIGSIEALTGQLAAARRDSQIGEVLGIYDGDTSEENLCKVFKSHLQRDLSEEDIRWFQSHKALLPGNCAPEKWIQNLLKESSLIKNISESIHATENELAPIFNTINPSDHHNLFYELSNRLGCPIDEIKNIISASITKTFPEKFESIIKAVENLLSGHSKCSQ